MDKVRVKFKLQAVEGADGTEVMVTDYEDDSIQLNPVEARQVAQYLIAFANEYQQ